MEDAKLYRERLLRTKDKEDKDWGLILIANKCDLEEFREVTKEEILEVANEWNCPVIETSAKARAKELHIFIQGVYAYWVNSQTRCVNINI